MIAQQLQFEDVAVGDELPTREHGPLTIEHTVRWAGVQENVAHLHYDRQWARDHANLPSFIASGAYRQALLARLIMDWAGPRGWLRKIGVRQMSPTIEGDLLRFSGRVVEKSDDPVDPWLICDLEGHNQRGKQVLSGRCTVLLPSTQNPRP